MFHNILLLLSISDHMLFIVEKILTTGADVPGARPYWPTECLTGTFSLEHCPVPRQSLQNRDGPSQNEMYGNGIPALDPIHTVAIHLAV